MGSTRRRYLIVSLTVAALACLAGGCTRHFFRNRADNQVDKVLSQKDRYPQWQIEQYHVYPDPRARFADWSNPDRPPMPPDDPAARYLSPNPQRPRRAGVAKIEGGGYLELLQQWDAENRSREQQEKEAAATVPTPDQSKPDGGAAPDMGGVVGDAERELAKAITPDGSPLPPGCGDSLPPTRPFLINLEQSVELALINSREFQAQRENLYLSALPVTAERFAFAAQFFAIEQVFRERFGLEATDGPANQWRFNSAAGVSKLFSTGALLLMNFANQTVYSLGKALPGTVSESTLSLDFIQPLLRGGGRAVTLEPLTQAERNLLYAIRDYARFRQQFFVFIAAGQSAFISGVQAGVPALSQPSVTQPGVFVPGAAPLPANAVGPDTAQVVPGDGARLFPTRGSSAPAQGYLSTIQNKAQLVNQYQNLRSLRNFLTLFQVYLEGGIVNSVQVGQIEQQLLRSTETALNNQVSYRNSLDQFKLQLGVPLTLPLELDDEPLEPMFAQTRRFEALTAEFEEMAARSLQYGKPEDAGNLRPRLRRLFHDHPIVRGTQFRQRLAQRWRDWEMLSDKPDKPAEKSPLEQNLDRLREQRRRLLDRKAGLPDQRLPEDEQRRLLDLEFDIEVGRFERSLRVYETQPWKALADPGRRQAQQLFLFLSTHRLFLSLMEGAYQERMEQVRVRWPVLGDLCVSGVDLLCADEQVAVNSVIQAAFDNRLDLMNRRAQLVDSWRQIAVSANALQGLFNVQYHLDTFTPPGEAKPFAFGAGRYHHQLIFNGQLPLVRILERNDYRSALVAYQQERRQLQLAEDEVAFAVRLDLRNLRATANNYQRVQKRAIELAYMQVDQALQAFSQPQAPPGPAPVGVGAPAAAGSGGDPAALTTQLLNTQNSLLNAQNDLYNTWLAYLTARMNLYRDMGLMPLDPRGVWIDGIASCPAACQPGPAPTQPQHDGPEQPPAPRAVPSAPGAALGPQR